MKTTTVRLNAAALAAVLAGLRLLQESDGVLPREIEEIYQGDGEFEPLELDAIDALCEEINVGPEPSALAPWSVHANGEANSYAIHRNDVKWYISLTMNGEMTPELQQEVLAWITRSSMDRTRVIDLFTEFDARFGDSVAEDLEIDGGDAVEWIQEFAPRLRSVLDSLNSFGPPERPLY